MNKRTVRSYGKNGLGQKRIRAGVQAVCNNCKARGPLYASDVIMPGSESHLEWMKDQAARWWNERLEDGEPTWEQVKDYCEKRCFVILDRGTFNALKARYSNCGARMDEVKA